MKSQVLYTAWCYISGEAAGEIWHWSLLGVKGLRLVYTYDARTSARKSNARLCLCRPGSHVAYAACAYACVVRVNQPLVDWGEQGHARNQIARRPQAFPVTLCWLSPGHERSAINLRALRTCSIAFRWVSAPQVAWAVRHIPAQEIDTVSAYQAMVNGWRIK